MRFWTGWQDSGIETVFFSYVYQCPHNTTRRDLLAFGGQREAKLKPQTDT